MSEGLNLKIADFVFSILPARTIKEFSPDKNYIPFITEGKADIVLKVSKKKSPRNQGDEYSFITSPWRYYQDQKRHIYNFFYSVKKGFSERVLILEPDFKKGEIILLPYLKGPVLRNPFSYPLDELIIINLLCRKYGLLVHSCGFVYKDKGYLFIGSSGAGKSTMARILERNRTFMSHRLTKNNKNLSPSPLIPSSFNSSPLVGEDKGGGFYYSPPIKGGEIFGLPSKVPSPLVGEGQGEGKLLDKNFSILSDDRIAVRKRNERYFIYGTPWHGTEKFASPEMAPLTGLFFLKKDTNNSLHEISLTDTVSRLIKCSFPPFWDREGMASTLKICEDIATSIPSFEFSFTPDDRAFDLIKKILTAETLRHRDYKKLRS